jgi:hypothetical protein
MMIDEEPVPTVVHGRHGVGAVERVLFAGNQLLAVAEILTALGHELIATNEAIASLAGVTAAHHRLETPDDDAIDDQPDGKTKPS